MASAVFDASALLALIRNEPGADQAAAWLPEAIISAVSLAEVQAMLVAAGLEEQQAWWHIAEAGCTSVPFDEEQAQIAGGLVRIARPLRLSLGDRACLALAIQRQAAVCTTDQAWKNLDLGIRIEVIR